MEDLDFRDILVREPFYTVLPTGYLKHGTAWQGNMMNAPEDKLQMLIYSQADFLRQYYPSGHLINDHIAYPDVIKQDPDTKKFYVQPVTRCAFAFQYVIAIKRVMHLVGNNIQCELSGAYRNDLSYKRDEMALLDFKQGWLDTDAQYNFYEAVNSWAIVADAAVVAYIKDGKARLKTLSFLNGDILYPHYADDGRDIELFARKYMSYDEKGKVVTEWVEIWDDKFYYKAKRGISSSTIIQKIKEVFGLSGYTIIEKKLHGFNFCPVAYIRSKNGPCWINSQPIIEEYEEAFSNFAENNKANAFPVFYTKGEDVDIKGDVYGAVKAVSINDPNGEAGYLKQGDVSTSFNTMLKELYDKIYELSFAVKPVEPKSGDLPGVAVKLLYSPAIEQAIHDVYILTPFLHKLVKLVKYAYGWQINKQATLANLKTNSWIEPYVHQNDSEIFTNIATAVQNGFLSHQTASERIPKYAKNDEISRIIQEDLQKRKLDMQAQIDLKREQLKADISKLKEQAKINKNKSGQDINTRSSRTRTTDKNGNRPGENNWDEWNETH